MWGDGVLLDSILVAGSLLMTMGYHAYLCHTLRHNPSVTTIGLNSIMRRRCWLHLQQQQQEEDGGDDDKNKKAMLAVQTLRNTLMSATLTATVTIIITLCLAALTNNTYNNAPPPNHRLFLLFQRRSPGKMIAAAKWGLATMLLMTSFLCSSMGIGCLIDANYNVVSAGGDGDSEGSSIAGSGWMMMMERGLKLAVVGNRVLCISLPILLWIVFGAVPAALSSLALIGALYDLDFPATTTLTSYPHT